MNFKQTENTTIESLMDLVDDLKACDPDALDTNSSDHVRFIISSNFNIIKRTIDYFSYSTLSKLYLHVIKTKRSLMKRNDKYSGTNEVVILLNSIAKMTNKMMELKLKKSHGIIFIIKRIFGKAIF